MFSKKYRNYFELIPVIISVVLISIYYYHFKRSLDFWDNIVGIFLSLVAGITFSLWINRLIKIEDEKEKIKVDRLREKDILLFIQQEIDFNSKLILQERIISKTNFHPLQAEMWEVLKSSGDLKLILNTELLNRITSAYDIILKVKHFEEKALDDWNVDNNWRDMGSTWQVQSARAKNFYSLLDESISKATSLITERIEIISADFIDH